MYYTCTVCCLSKLGGSSGPVGGGGAGAAVVAVATEPSTILTPRKPIFSTGNAARVFELLCAGSWK